MNAKRKMAIAISSCAVVILAVVIAVVAVLAAQNVTIKSSVNVSYNADKIIGTVTAKYQVKNGSEANIGDGSWGFDGDETGDAATVNGSANSIVLSETDNYVDFIFTFTNDGTAAYTATVTLPSSDKIENLTVSYPGDNTDDSALTVPVGQTKTFKIRYTITNADLDAKLENASFQWTLA